MRDQYIQAIFNQYMGKRDQAGADLQVYLNNPTAIGDHGDIGNQIQKKIEEVDKYDSLIQTMQSLFLSVPDEDDPTPTKK